MILCVERFCDFSHSLGLHDFFFWRLHDIFVQRFGDFFFVRRSCVFLFEEVGDFLCEKVFLVEKKLSGKNIFW